MVHLPKAVAAKALAKALGDRPPSSSLLAMVRKRQREGCQIPAPPPFDAVEEEEGSNGHAGGSVTPGGDSSAAAPRTPLATKLFGDAEFLDVDDSEVRAAGTLQLAPLKKEPPVPSQPQGDKRPRLQIVESSDDSGDDDDDSRTSYPDENAKRAKLMHLVASSAVASVEAACLAVCSFCLAKYKDSAFEGQISSGVSVHHQSKTKVDSSYIFFISYNRCVKTPCFVFNEHGVRRYVALLRTPRGA